MAEIGLVFLRLPREQGEVGWEEEGEKSKALDTDAGFRPRSYLLRMVVCLLG
jgi:hypothetical protein